MQYIIELFAFFAIWLIGALVIKYKFKKSIVKYSLIIFAIFIFTFVIINIFERPSTEVKDVQNISQNLAKNYTDTACPRIILVGEKECIQPYNEEYVEPGFIAIDSYEGNLTDRVSVIKEQINEKEYNIKYIVQDSAGNKAEKTRHITIIDNVAPVVTLNGEENYFLNINETYEEQGATAVDEIDGDISQNIETEGTVDTSQEGIYTINYKVKDSSQNETTKQRTITIVKPETLSAQETAPNGGIIYLTFDDGPTISSTPLILDILNKKGVKATFFIINYNEEEEQLVKREYNEGHTVAIHGYSHKYSEIYQSVDTYMENITKLQEKIRNTTGYSPTITRFPGGSSNTVSKKYCPGIMTTLTNEVIQRGYTYFDWNVDSDDAGKAKNSDDIYRNVTTHVKPGRANVVLMHDFSDNYKTIEALESIIDFGLSNGYTFDKITENTQAVRHNPNN